MARPAKPTKTKELQGTARPDRLLPNEIQPQTVTLPVPPDWLSEYGKDEWYLQTGEMEQIGILTAMDLSTLAMFCQQVGIFRQAQQDFAREGSFLVVETPNGALQPNPLLSIANKAADLALKIAGQFGFTPSARTRIGSPKKQQKDPFEEYMTGKK